MSKRKTVTRKEITMDLLTDSKGRRIPVRSVHHHEAGDVLISTETISDIWAADDDGMDPLDDSIYRFAEDDVFFDYSDAEFEEYINKYID